MIEKNPEIVLRKVGDFYFLIDPRKSYNSENEDIFQTNEIGVLIWNTIGVESSFDAIYNAFLLQITDELTDELRNEVKQDIADFIDQLKKNGFVYED